VIKAGKNEQRKAPNVSSNFMTTLKQIILTILTVCVLTSCNPNFENLFIENIEHFELNRAALNNVIVDIEKTTVKNWDRRKDLIIQVDSLNEKTKKTLTDLGIGSIELTNNPNANCDKNYWITLNVVDDWNIRTLRVVQLVYAPCDKNTEKNYHYSDGYHRDIWGQGDNWFIYTDTDLL